MCRRRRLPSRRGQFQAGANADSELSASQLRHPHLQAADVGGVGTWAPVRPTAPASQPAQPPQQQGTAADASSLFDLSGLEIKAQPVPTPAPTGQPCVSPACTVSVPGMCSLPARAAAAFASVPTLGQAKSVVLAQAPTPAESETKPFGHVAGADPLRGTSADP